jgi:autotransporter-associated beta strand protein
VIGLARGGDAHGRHGHQRGELRIRTSNNRAAHRRRGDGQRTGHPQPQRAESAGRLAGGHGQRRTGAGTLTIDGSASTTFDGAVKNIANAGASGVTSGSGRIIKSGSGVITFNGQNDISGSVTLNAGGITVGSGALLAGAVADLVLYDSE